VVEGATVVVGAVVVGSTVAVVLGGRVVVGAVTVGWLVVAPKVENASLVVVGATVPGAATVVGRAVVGGRLTARRRVWGVVVGAVGALVGAGGAVVVGEAAVGAGVAGRVGGTWLGACWGSVGWWGSRVAEATRAARSAVVSPKANSSARQGRRGLAR
jgi:hypothetical protein